MNRQFKSAIAGCLGCVGTGGQYPGIRAWSRCRTQAEHFDYVKELFEAD